MTDNLSSISPAKPRLGRLDVLRGIALIAMAAYHTGWDFEFFGYLEPGTTGQGAWKLYARIIASTFLMLVGFSLVLGHGRGFRVPRLRGSNARQDSQSGRTIQEHDARTGQER